MQVVGPLVICGIFEFILVVEGIINPHVQGAIATLIGSHLFLRRYYATPRLLKPPPEMHLNAPQQPLSGFYSHCGIMFQRK
jgi:hypothetical protein